MLLSATACILSAIFGANRPDYTSAAAEVARAVHLQLLSLADSAPTWSYSRPYGATADRLRALSLAHHWAHPDFVAPLQKTLDSDWSVPALHAAAALARHPDPSLRIAIARYRGTPRFRGPFADDLERILSTIAVPEADIGTFEQSVETQRDRSLRAVWPTNGCVAVSSALALLRDRDRSRQTDGALCLFSLGIAIAPSLIEEAWTRAGPEGKSFLLRLVPDEDLECYGFAGLGALARSAVEWASDGQLTNGERVGYWRLLREAEFRDAIPMATADVLSAEGDDEFGPIWECREQGNYLAELLAHWEGPELKSLVESEFLHARAIGIAAIARADLKRNSSTVFGFLSECSDLDLMTFALAHIVIGAREQATETFAALPILDLARNTIDLAGVDEEWRSSYASHLFGALSGLTGAESPNQHLRSAGKSQLEQTVRAWDAWFASRRVDDS